MPGELWLASHDLCVSNTFVYQLEALGKDGDIAGILERMMGQLLSKDVLYDPLKEISQRVRAELHTPAENYSPARLHATRPPPARSARRGLTRFARRGPRRSTLRGS